MTREECVKQILAVNLKEHPITVFKNLLNIYFEYDHTSLFYRTVFNYQYITEDAALKDIQFDMKSLELIQHYTKDITNFCGIYQTNKKTGNLEDIDLKGLQKKLLTHLQEEGDTL